MIGAGQQPDKQTNKPTDTETGKHLGRKKKKILTNRRRSRFAVDKRAHRGKQEVKNETLFSAVIEKN